MCYNRLQLNTAKTEVLWSTSSRRLHLLPMSPIRMGIDQAKPVSVVWNLGIYINADVSVRSHVTKTVAACFSILRQLRIIHRSLPRYVMSSIVLQQLDYGNAMLAGIPYHLIKRMQSAMILLFGFCFRIEVWPHHAAPHTATLAEGAGADRSSWLFWHTDARQTAPHALTEEFHHSSAVEACQRLRSTSSSLLVVRCTRLSTIGQTHCHLRSSFSGCSFRLWNTLLQNVTSASSRTVFRKRLKTNLFSHSFPKSSVMPVQWLCHFGRSIFLLTYLLNYLHTIFKSWILDKFYLEYYEEMQTANVTASFCRLWAKS